MFAVAVVGQMYNPVLFARVIVDGGGDERGRS